MSMQKVQKQINNLMIKETGTSALFYLPNPLSSPDPYLAPISSRSLLLYPAPPWPLFPQNHWKKIMLGRQISKKLRLPRLPPKKWYLKKKKTPKDPWVKKQGSMFSYLDMRCSYLQRLLRWVVEGGSFLPRFFEASVFLVIELLSIKGEFFAFERRTRPVCISEKLGAFFDVRREKEGSGIGILWESGDSEGSSTAKSDGSISRPDRVLRGPSSFLVYT